MEMKMFVVAARFYKGNGTWPDGNPRKNNTVIFAKQSQDITSLPEKFSFEDGKCPRVDELRMGQEIVIDGDLNNGRFYANGAKLPVKVS